MPLICALSIALNSSRLLTEPLPSLSASTNAATCSQNPRASCINIGTRGAKSYSNGCAKPAVSPVGAEWSLQLCERVSPRP